MPEHARESIRQARTVVVKVGTAVITTSAAALDRQALRRLAGEVAELTAQGRRVVLVSSGAIGAGLGQLGSHQLIQIPISTCRVAELDSLLEEPLQISTADGAQQPQETPGRQEPFLQDLERAIVIEDEQIVWLTELIGETSQQQGRGAGDARWEPHCGPQYGSPRANIVLQTRHEPGTGEDGPVCYVQWRGDAR